MTNFNFITCRLLNRAMKNIIIFLLPIYFATLISCEREMQECDNCYYPPPSVDFGTITYLENEGKEQPLIIDSMRYVKKLGASHQIMMYSGNDRIDFLISNNTPNASELRFRYNSSPRANYWSCTFPEETISSAPNDPELEGIHGMGTFIEFNGWGDGPLLAFEIDSVRLYKFSQDQADIPFAVLRNMKFNYIIGDYIKNLPLGYEERIQTDFYFNQSEFAQEVWPFSVEAQSDGEFISFVGEYNSGSTIEIRFPENYDQGTYSLDPQGDFSVIYQNDGLNYIPLSATMTLPNRFCGNFVSGNFRGTFIPEPGESGGADSVRIENGFFTGTLN